MLVVRAAEMVRMDRQTIDEIGIPGIVLMENAGRGAAAFFEEVVDGLLSKKIAIICGGGNNAGDGFVLARLFWEEGASVQVVCLRPAERLRGDALTNFKVIEKLGVPIHVWDEQGDFDSQWRPVREAEAVVDALLGTGLNSEVSGLYRDIVEAMNELTVPMLAVDVPSGLDATTGKVLGVAVRATATATFGLPKIGQLVAPGEDYVGRLSVVDIGIPSTVIESAGIKTWWLDASTCSRWLAPRPPAAHKGHAGHVAVLAGSPGKTGAAALLCQGAGRAGAGLVTLLIPESLNAVMEVKITEAMTLPIVETAEHTAAHGALPEILEFLQDKQVLAMGPGVSLHPETQALVRDLVVQAPCSMVLDADALTALTGDLERLHQAERPLILTPHPGEMARMLQTTTQAVQENRLETAEDFSRRFGVTLVLKGHRTIVAAPDGRLAVNGSGNPAMASGGMGDVLTGMIAGFLGQGCDPFEAAALGVYIHGAAADLCFGKVAGRGLLAGDLLPAVPKVIGRLEGFPCES